MIDQDWLRSLEIDLGQGYRLNGVYVGGTAAVIRVIHPDGAEYAYRLPKKIFQFPGYIREVPNWLVPRPQYDVQRLNRKLANLLGDPQLHILINRYDRLFSQILESFYQARETNLDSVLIEPEEARQIWRFVIQTPAITYRLQDCATDKSNRQKGAWAEQTLTELAQLCPGDPDLSPETLFDNPLVVWGGAVSEGFFTKAEFPQAVSAVEEQLDALPEEQIQVCLSQMYALVFMLNSSEGSPATARISMFCDATGFFQESFATEEQKASPDELGSFLEGIKRPESEGDR